MTSYSRPATVNMDQTECNHYIGQPMYIHTTQLQWICTLHITLFNLVSNVLNRMMRILLQCFIWRYKSKFSLPEIFLKTNSHSQEASFFRNALYLHGMCLFRNKLITSSIKVGQPLCLKGFCSYVCWSIRLLCRLLTANFLMYFLVYASLCDEWWWHTFDDSILPYQ